VLVCVELVAVADVVVLLTVTVVVDVEQPPHIAGHNGIMNVFVHNESGSPLQLSGSGSPLQRGVVVVVTVLVSVTVVLEREVVLVLVAVIVVLV
jgi:hypothetical protein